MKKELDRLYELLPVVYRQRDAEAGEPLRALLQVISEQVNLVEDDIGQLYENWFIETCEDWVVPYLADLIGYRLVHEAGEPGPVTTAAGILRNKILVPRREIANTIRYRRRKGAVALLELLSHDVAGWPARAVEFYRHLGWSQHLNYSNPQRGRTVDVRHGAALEHINGPFEELAHTVDVRRINSHRRRERYNISSLGIFAWRLKAYPLTKSPAFCTDKKDNLYTFSILGNDAPLFTLPVAEPDPTHIADEMNVPAPIRRRAFTERTADYYGEGKSLYIWRDFKHPVPLDDIVPADLTNWAYRPQENQVAVDPELGRIVFSNSNRPQTGVWVSYHYGLSADIGGGEYEQHLRPPKKDTTVYRVSKQRGARADTNSLAQALDIWREQDPDDAIIQIEDSGAYLAQIDLQLRGNQRLEIRAASGARPVLRLLNWYANQPDVISVGPREAGQERAGRVVFDGLLITGRSVQVTGPLKEFVLRHCTLVPGWSLDRHCNPENESEPSLELIDTDARVQIEHSIVGTIVVTQNEVATDPISINISDSVVDATRTELDALGGPQNLFAHAQLRIQRSTVYGKLRVHAIELAENSIFDGLVRVARSQTGCMRFCYVPPGSRTPRRYNCQPDAATGELKGDEKLREQERVQPHFKSRRYGTPAYCQLADMCPEEIRSGADDESEMGVFHRLFQPQREANLRARLDEFTPAGLDAGIIFAT